MIKPQVSSYIYTYTCHVDEVELCKLEMRSFFGFDVASNLVISTEKIEPSRSPFIRSRLDVLYEADDLAEIARFAQGLELGEITFKVLCLNTVDFGDTKKIRQDERHQVEREIALSMQAEADLKNPDLVFGVVLNNNRWYFGYYIEGEAVWFKHQQKPEMYSTALSTRVARAVANIAIPNPAGVRAIDPCCGIGTVLVEALSMGMNIVGSDINPLVAKGSRTNIAHFGLQGEVLKGDIAEITESYDVAIIDMPYNLFTHISIDEQFTIIKEARRIATRVVLVTIDTIDDMVNEAGFTIVDRCIVKKGTFERQVLVCE
ncbi:RNA methyltransferase [Lysinibacillus contaminans]|uniref:RNA methyltransferase n=1 Tax=Lysinibacillus contaminans TaxID=1293441 RepID=A0ABR5K6E2_9BACI|nr:RsmD family RNA methyltransferase [Lysinibacillus contaminans]KOS71715.1 RNA methyltransferase [Lysinibacillus contaminans]